LVNLLPNVFGEPPPHVSEPLSPFKDVVRNYIANYWIG